MRGLSQNPNINLALKIAEKTNYINPNYEYLKNVNISEWDIHSAGLSVIKFKKLLPEETIKMLETLPKKERTIKEGLLQKENPNLAKEIIETLSQAMKAFILVNHIEDTNILSIKKDAIFLINKQPEITEIKDFIFREKNKYTSWAILSKKEFYYNSFLNILDVKGLSDSIKRENNFILEELKKFLNRGESLDQVTLFKLWKIFRGKYLKRELPLEAYRELETGKFRLNEYVAESVSNNDLPDLDISQNYLNFILPLIQYQI